MAMAPKPIVLDFEYTKLTENYENIPTFLKHTISEIQRLNIRKFLKRHAQFVGTWFLKIRKIENLQLIWHLNIFENGQFVNLK